jgi:hypothetical protein
MTPVHVVVETNEASFVHYTVHVVNRSRHALTGALRGAFRKFPDARSAEAEFAGNDTTRLTLFAAHRAHAQEA